MHNLVLFKSKNGKNVSSHIPFSNLLIVVSWNTQSWEDSEAMSEFNRKKRQGNNSNSMLKDYAI